MVGRVQAGSGVTEPRPQGNRSKPKLRRAPSRSNKSKGNGSGGGAGNRVSSMAAQLVQAQIRQGVNDARKERRVVRRESDTATRKARKDHRRALGDLNYIFGETSDYMGAMGQQINQNYTDASSRAAQAQAALTQQLQANSQNNAAAVGGTFNEFGITGMDMGDYQSDALMGQQLASQNAANQQASISAQQQGAQAISALLQGMNAGSKMSQYGIQGNALSDSLYDIEQNKRDGYTQVREAISDLRGKRGDLTLQMLQQLGGSQWAKYLAPNRGNRGRGGRGGGSYSQSYSSGGYSGGTGGSSGGGKKPGKPGKGNSGGTTSGALNDLLLGQLNSRR